MSSRWTVNGRSASSKSEYDAFLREFDKIDHIKKKVDLKNDSQLEKLYSSICTGSLKFESKVGFDFEDEINELYDKKFAKKRNKERIQSNERIEKKNTLKDIPKDFDESERIKYRQKVEFFDDDVDKELVDYYIEKQRKRKELIKFAVIAVLILIVVASFATVVIKVLTDKNHERVLAEIEQSNKDNAFVFTTIKQSEPESDGTITFDTYEIPPVLNKYSDTYEKNEDLVGWIKIEDTNIDYPVVQGEDNEYYLSHNFKGKNDANGCIFVDMNCSIYPRSKNIILYGHHMKSGKMFANLEKYDNYDFYINHRKFTFDTIYEEAEYEIVFVFRDYVHASDDTEFKYYEFVDVTSETEFESYMTDLRNKSIYNSNIPVSFDDELLTLSTCDYMQANGRFVVMAKKIK